MEASSETRYEGSMPTRFIGSLGGRDSKERLPGAALRRSDLVLVSKSETHLPASEGIKSEIGSRKVYLAKRV